MAEPKVLSMTTVAIGLRRGAAEAADGHGGLRADTCEVIFFTIRPDADSGIPTDFDLELRAGTGMISLVELSVVAFPNAESGLDSACRQGATSMLVSTEGTEAETIPVMSRLRSGFEEAGTEGDAERETDTGEPENLESKQGVPGVPSSARRTWRAWGVEVFILEREWPRADRGGVETDEFRQARDASDAGDRDNGESAVRRMRSLRGTDL